MQTVTLSRPPAVPCSAWLLSFSNHIRAIEPTFSAVESATQAKTAHAFCWLLDATEAAELWADAVRCRI
jgi:hypothetical protein